jgi:hypothetical protein
MELRSHAAEQRSEATEQSRKVAAHLGILEKHILKHWGFSHDRDAFVSKVEAILGRNLAWAARWHLEMTEASDLTLPEMEQRLVGCLREERLTRNETNVLDTCVGMLDEPDEHEAAPPVRPYLAWWVATLLLVLYMGYYLLTTGSQFGLKKSKHWLISCAFSIFLYFVFMKPCVIFLFFVAVPGLLGTALERVRDPVAQKRYPFAMPLPSDPSFFLLQWHPELSATRAGAHVLASAAGAADPRAGRALDAKDIKRICNDNYVKTGWTTAMAIAVGSSFFTLNEDIQELILEEFFSFAPLLSGPIMGPISSHLPTPGGKGGGVATAIGILLCVLSAIVAYELIKRFFWVYAKVKEQSRKAARAMRARVVRRFPASPPTSPPTSPQSVFFHECTETPPGGLLAAADPLAATGKYVGKESKPVARIEAKYEPTAAAGPPAEGAAAEAATDDAPDPPASALDEDAAPEAFAADATETAAGAEVLDDDEAYAAVATETAAGAEVLDDEDLDDNKITLDVEIERRPYPVFALERRTDPSDAGEPKCARRRKKRSKKIKPRATRDADTEEIRERRARRKARSEEGAPRSKSRSKSRTRSKSGSRPRSKSGR